MSTGYIRFRVPENTDDIEEVIVDHVLVYEDTADGHPLEGQAVIAELETSRGEMFDLYIHDDEDEPGLPFHELLTALTNEHAPYFGYCNSYTERSRGERSLAQISINANGSKGEEIRRFLDWQHGEPGEQRIEATMANAGFSQQEIDTAIETFFSPEPALKP